MNRKRFVAAWLGLVLAAGFDAVLPKPFGLDDLIHAFQLAREAAGVVSRAATPDSSAP